MDLIKIEENNKYSVFKLDKEIEKIIGKNQKALDEFMEEIKKANTLGNHINLIKICQIPDGLEDRPEWTIMESYCENYKMCSLYMRGEPPIGCKCPYEIAYVYQLSQDLFRELSIEINNQSTERLMIEDFISYNLIKYRMEKVLAVSNIMVNSIEVTKIGSNYKKELNPILSQLSSIDKIIDNIRKRFIADRESKLKFGLESAKIKVDQEKVKMIKAMDSKTKVNNNNKLGLIIEEDDDDILEFPNS